MAGSAFDYRSGPGKGMKVAYQGDHLARRGNESPIFEVELTTLCGG